MPLEKMFISKTKVNVRFFTGLGTSRKDSIDSGTFSRTLTINSQSSAGSNDNPERQSQTPPPLPEPRKGRTKSQSTGLYHTLFF